MLFAAPFAAQVYAAPGSTDRPGLYDTQANGTADIAAAVARADSSGKRVLVQFGANWCGWCHKLHEMFETNATVKRMLDENYVVVLVDVDQVDGKQHNADVVERYGNPVRFGLPVIVVLDGEGKQLHTQNTGDLETGSSHDEGKVMAFLKAWAPTGA
jgi:thiol:disulfide interchange protein